jgi:hypothetical protein
VLWAFPHRQRAWRTLSAPGGLSQGRAAELPGINQPKVSALSKCRLEGFSVARLMRFLTSLNQDVEIIIHNRLERPPRGSGRSASVS